MRLLNQAVAENRAVLLVTCKTAPGEEFVLDHVRLNCDDRDTITVMIGQLVEMVVTGTETPLIDVLKALGREVQLHRGG